MRQFRGLLVVVVVLGGLVGAGLLAFREERPAPVAASPAPAPTSTPTPAVVPATPTPSPSPSESPTPPPTPAPSPPRAFLEPLRIEGTSEATTSITTLAEIAPKTARFTVTLAHTGAVPARAVPAFTVRPFAQSQLPGATGELEITIPNATDATTNAREVSVGPVRSVAVGSPVTFPAKVYRLGLDAFPLWRAMVLFDPTRIVIDVGGPPGSVSDDGNTAVYAPVPGAEVGRTFRLTGAARAFEATFLWRVRDASGAAVARGNALASIGTSALWGSFEVDVTVPPSTSGGATLEVYQVSPRDGSEVSVATVPLQVRR